VLYVRRRHRRHCVRPRFNPLSRVPVDSRGRGPPHTDTMLPDCCSQRGLSHRPRAQYWASWPGKKQPPSLWLAFGCPASKARIFVASQVTACAIT
jgi:hypothetical protein